MSGIRILVFAFAALLVFSACTQESQEEATQEPTTTPVVETTTEETTTAESTEESTDDSKASAVDCEAVTNEWFAAWEPSLENQEHPSGLTLLEYLDANGCKAAADEIRAADAERQRIEENRRAMQASPDVPPDARQEASYSHEPQPPKSMAEKTPEERAPVVEQRVRENPVVCNPQSNLTPQERERYC